MPTLALPSNGKEQSGLDHSVVGDINQCQLKYGFCDEFTAY